MLNRMADKTIIIVAGIISLLVAVYILFPRGLHVQQASGQAIVRRNTTGNIVWSKPEPLDWKKILFFIPNLKDESCERLFSTAKSQNIARTSSTYPKFKKLLAVIRKEAERLKHINHNHAPLHEKLTLTYQELAKLPWVKTVCEIGFDQGQSAIAWLTSKPDLILHSFDIGIALGKTPYMAKLVRTMFKQRFTFHVGSSDMIMPLWAERMKGQCDIVSIDGGHNLAQVFPDLINMRKMAAKKHMIVADDIEYPGVKAGWTMFKELNIVTEAYRCHMKGIDIDFVLGQYGPFFWDSS